MPPERVSQTYVPTRLVDGGYVWFIEKFSQQPKALKSPTFRIGNNGEVKLQLHLFQTIIGDELWYQVCVCVHEIAIPLSKVDMKHLFSVETASGKEFVLSQEVTTHLFEGNFVGMQLMTKKFLLEQRDVYLPNDTLMIQYKMYLHKSTAKFGITAHSILKDLRDLYQSQKASDVKLLVDSEEFAAHKAILSARSPVFLTMFATDMQESQKNEVKIEEIDPAAFKDFLNFIYTDEIENLEDHAFELLRAAHRYELPKLRFLCEKQLCKNLDVENCAAIFSAADLYNSEELKQRTLKYIVDNAFDVMKTAGYELMARSHPHLMMEACQALANKLTMSEK